MSGSELPRLQTHVAHGVTPVAVAGAATDGADLEMVVAAGREAAHGQGAGAGELMPDHYPAPAA